MAQAKRPCSSGPSCSSAVPSRPPPRLGRARPGGSRCVTLSARAAFQTNTTCSAGPEGKKRRKKGQKRKAWPLADAANRARGFWRAGRAPGEAARGWWPGWVLSPVPVPVPTVPALPSFLIPTRKHFFRRQYWHWLRWCWSIWQSRLDLQGGQGRGGTGQHRDGPRRAPPPPRPRRCPRARPRSLLPVPRRPCAHTHTHTLTHSPARRCYGNRDRELFPTARAEDLCFQQCPGVWESRRSPRGAGGAPEREEKRRAEGLGAPTPR